MYQECSEDSKGTIVDEWDEAGKDGQRGVLKGLTVLTNLLFIFSFAFTLSEMRQDYRILT